MEQPLGRKIDGRGGIHSVAIKDLNEVVLKDLKLKLNNNILATKSLYEIRKHDICLYCKREPEIFLYLFVECDKVKEF